MDFVGRLDAGWLPIAGAGFVCFASAYALSRGTALAAVVPLVCLAACVLILRPSVVLSAFLAAIILFEDDAQGFLPGRQILYEGPPSIAELVFVLLVVATAVELILSRRETLLPTPFTLPLLLVAVAGAGGVATGYLAGADPLAILNAFRPLLPLIVLPILVVNLVRDARAALAMALGGVILAMIKALEGLFVWATGSGRPYGATTITFYEPAANVLLLLLVLTVVAAVVKHVPLAWWVRFASVLAFVTLILTFRRSFWIGTLVALLFVLLLGSGARGWRLLAPALAVAVTASYVAVQYVDAREFEGSGSVAARALTLEPSRLVASKEDRYRIDEQVNVLAELRAHPVGGLGFGVPWRATQALPFEWEGGRTYVHNAFLLHWLRSGALGALAYISLLLTLLVTGYRLAGRLRDGRLQAVTLAVAAAVPGLMLIELTAAYGGVDIRFSVVVGAIVGWVAALSRIVSEDVPVVD
jgi:O-antigen ligase